MDFSGKVAVVTGGANGIGAAVCHGLAQRGARGVLVVDRDAAAGEATAAAIRAAGGHALFAAADVSQSRDVQAYVKLALDTWGAIDCFHNNAGIEGRIAPTAEYDEAVFDSVIAVNVKGVFLGLRHVLPVMLKQGHGAIVNTASVAAIFGTSGMPAYVASKHAVAGLTKVAAGEVGPQGIRVNAVLPGPIDTRMVRDIARQVSPNNPDAVEAGYAGSIPLRRYGTAEEVANVVLFLLCDLAGNVTGAQYVVDGGRSAAPAGVSAHVE
ncbi:MAG: SDR family oxidoreductase [Acetobacteraceae bacterium]|nr:SDR family oxidoreductase [Acetobacteraceae bacterium]